MKLATALSGLGITPPARTYIPTELSDYQAQQAQGFLVLAPMPVFAQDITEVMQNRQQSRDFLQKILAVQKINGNIEAFNFTIPDFFKLQDYSNHTAIPKNEEPWLSLLQKSCGDRPTGLRFKARSQWYDCLDRFTQDYTPKYYAIQASLRELAWIKTKFQDIEALTKQKVIANTSQQDLTDTNNESAQGTKATGVNAVYAIGGALLLLGAGYLTYRVISKRKQDK
jgi:hypothetical protein